MNSRHFFRFCRVAALATLIAGFGLGQAMAAPLDAADGQEGVEVLTRGPVHEAFAETVTFDPEPGIVAPKAPPAAIEELPPDQKPEGANVAWIPGYWAWDDDRNDFLWVSGIWRALPPGRQWVPGYWGESAKGVQWTSGYWADAKASEIEYLPEPPATAEAGPNIAAPSPDQSWLPGCWVWQQGRYLWRPGYWAAVQPDWDWVPAHYVWAPRGYVYVDGYWDYSVGRRGVLFAPVFFDASVYARQGFSYSPAVVINPAVFASQLFLRPNYQHYYFGDYYGSNYAAAGFYPWFSYNSSRYGYDPICAQQRWQHRQDPRWAQTVQTDYQHRVDHPDARPPRTWAAQQAQMTTSPSSGEKPFVIAATLNQLTKSKDSPLRFQPIDQTERQKLGQNGQDVRKFVEERQKLETTAPAAPAETSSRKFEAARVKFPASPIMAKLPDQPEKSYTPPKAHQLPQPDLKIEPQPRTVAKVESSKLEPTAMPHQVLKPALQSQPQQPQPNVEQPALQSQPQPKVEQPAPAATGKAAAPLNGPAGPPSSGPTQDKPKDKVERPTPGTTGKPAAPLSGPAGPPSAGPTQDKPKDRGKH